MAVVIVGAGLLFFLGHALSWFFLKTKIPDLLILVCLGFIMGPIMGWVTPQDLGKVGAFLSTLALVVILYEGGLHLTAKDLIESFLPASLLSLLSFFSIVLVGTVIAHFLGGQSWAISILTGVGIGSTSSAIVIPMVKFLSVKDKTKTVLSLESAITDVLAIVIFLVLLDGFSKGLVSPQALLIGIGPNTLLAGLFGFAGALVWAIVKKYFPHLTEMTFSGEAWALLCYGSIELVQLNGAIGVLCLGFGLANLNLLPSGIKMYLNTIPVSYKDLSLLKELTFLLKTFFFLYLGMLIQFSSVQILLIALLVTVCIFVLRYLIILAFYNDKESPLDSFIMMGMGPRGLACAVLATLPLQKGLAGGLWIQDTIFAIIPFTILFTAIIVAVCENPKARKKLDFIF